MSEYPRRVVVVYGWNLKLWDPDANFRRARLDPDPCALQFLVMITCVASMSRGNSILPIL